MYQIVLGVDVMRKFRHRAVRHEREHQIKISREQFEVAQGRDHSAG